ncbi:MAG: hypothetical protein NC548_60780, partial [Lachnospiraceae bacterium]|nr:hypothetical protein [Lachnospiraceae bacterium]
SAMAVNVLIRPRGGDFVYDTRELAVMEADIEAVKTAGAQGVVIGALTAAGDIDMPAMKRLLKHCDGLDVTFHRAFDVCANPMEALEKIIELGIPRLLTSGGKATAFEGLPLICELTKQAAGRISIMPGSGVTPLNIDAIEAASGVEEFHSTCTDKSLPCPHEDSLFGCAARSVSSAIVSKLVYRE